MPQELRGARTLRRVGRLELHRGIEQPCAGDPQVVQRDSARPWRWLPARRWGCGRRRSTGGCDSVPPWRHRWPPGGRGQSTRVRSALATYMGSDRTLPPRPARWLAVEIPLGTVWSEETAFRGALSTLAADAFGARGGRLLQAVTSDSTHVLDARGTGETGARHRAATESRDGPRTPRRTIRQSGGADAGTPGDQRGRRTRRSGGAPFRRRQSVSRCADPHATREAVRAIAGWLPMIPPWNPTGPRSGRPRDHRSNERWPHWRRARVWKSVSRRSWRCTHCRNSHTRGTPPNVVETDPRTWLRLACGLTGFDEAAERGLLDLSGARHRGCTVVSAGQPVPNPIRARRSLEASPA